MRLVRTGTCLGVSLVHPYLTSKPQSQRSPTFCQHCDMCSGPVMGKHRPSLADALPTPGSPRSMLVTLMPRVQAWSLGPGHEGLSVALKLLPWFARADLALPGGGLSAPATGRRSCPCPGPGSHSHQSAAWPWEVSSLIMHPWQASEEYICSCMEHSYMHEHMNMCVASD